MTKLNTISLNGFAKSLVKLFRKEKEESISKKTYGDEQEDNYLPELNKKLKELVSSIKTQDAGKEKSTSDDKKISRPKTQDARLKISKPETRNSQLISLTGDWKKQNPLPNSIIPVSDVFREFPKFQVSIQNTGKTEKEITLWGSNQEQHVSPPAPEDVHDHVITKEIRIEGASAPVRMMHNPVSKLSFALNQLSGTVNVFDQENRLIKTIQLEPSWPGLNSPVDLTVVTNPQSSRYGFVYVAGSVANTISVIDLALNVVEEIPVAIRPMAIKFNPVNNLVYVANLTSSNLSVIDPETNKELPGERYQTGTNPIDVEIDPGNGDIYTADTLDDSLTVYDKSNIYLAIIKNIESRPESITWNPANESMYVIPTKGERIFQVNPQQYNLQARLSIGNKPFSSFYNSSNNYLYVQNRGDNSINVLDASNGIVDTIYVRNQNATGSFNPDNKLIYIPDPLNNNINVIGYREISSNVFISDDYFEINRSVQAELAQVIHARFTVNGQERIHTFRLNRFTPTGKLHSKFISFEKYAHPLNRLNVAEVKELNGTMLDGKTNWKFKLPARHAVSILIWIRPLLKKKLLETLDTGRWTLDQIQYTQEPNKRKFYISSKTEIEKIQRLTSKV